MTLYHSVEKLGKILRNPARSSTATNTQYCSLLCDYISDEIYIGKWTGPDYLWSRTQRTRGKAAELADDKNVPPRPGGRAC